MSTKQGPSCVNTFLMKYRIALRTWMFNSLLGSVVQAVVGYHVVHGLAQWPGSVCAAGAGRGGLLPVPWEVLWVSSSTARAQRAGQLHPHPGIPQDCAHSDPYRRILVLIWAFIVQIVGVTLKWVWLSRQALAWPAVLTDVRGGGGGGCWVAPSLLPSAQHQPVMALMVCSVSPRRSSHRCSFLIILPQCQSLLAWQQPLHLSAVLWAEHNQNPCVMGSFPVSELFGYVNNVVRMSVC